MTIQPDLAVTLQQLGVHFVAGQENEPLKLSAAPVDLLCGLASSREARMRLALIPLFLQRPDYAQYVAAAAQALPPAASTVLCCYYTAAQLLQQKYWHTLTALLGNFAPLPALFGHELDLDREASPEWQLRQLARQQSQLSGLPLNWYGTYEHAYRRLVRHTHKRKEWQI